MSSKQTGKKTTAKRTPKKQTKSATKKPPAKATKKVPNGRTIKTKDKYLPVDKKGTPIKLKDKRFVAVIDSNTDNELAVVRFTTQKQPNTTALPSYKKGNKKKTRFKHFVEITDNEGNPIKIDGIKFIENGKEYDLTVDELKKIKDKVLNNSKQSSENRKKIAKLKQKKR